MTAFLIGFFLFSRELSHRAEMFTAISLRNAVLFVKIVSLDDRFYVLLLSDVLCEWIFLSIFDTLNVRCVDTIEVSENGEVYNFSLSNQVLPSNYGQ